MQTDSSFRPLSAKFLAILQSVSPVIPMDWKKLNLWVFEQTNGKCSRFQWERKAINLILNLAAIFPRWLTDRRGGSILVWSGCCMLAGSTNWWMTPRNSIGFDKCSTVWGRVKGTRIDSVPTQSYYPPTLSTLPMGHFLNSSRLCIWQHNNRGT